MGRLGEILGKARPAMPLVRTGVDAWTVYILEDESCPVVVDLDSRVTTIV